MTLMGALIVMSVALLTIMIPSELHGLCLSVTIGANTIFGVALAPIVVSRISAAIGGVTSIGEALALVCVAAGTLSAAMFLYGRRYLTCGAAA
jgi:hypothetical protein